jgi:hypothetical protein
MNSKNFDQIKSYSTLIVAELHKAIFAEAIFDALKPVLALAEELECAVMEIERKQKETRNVVLFKRIA